MKLVNYYLKLENEVKGVLPSRWGVILFFLAFPISVFSQWQPSNTTLNKADKILSQFFSSEYSKSAIDLNSNYFQIITSDSIIAYACLQQAPSKHDRFDFLAIYSSEMELLKLRVLAYRENYGGEIANQRWLNQFLTRPSKNVQAISGATISVESLKRAVSNLNRQMKKWYEEKS